MPVLFSFVFPVKPKLQEPGSLARSRILNRGERGLAGITVQLLNMDGTVAATTTTGYDGFYHFDGLDLGSFKLQVVPPAGVKQTTASPTVTLTRGMTVSGVNLGLQKIVDTGLTDPLGKPLA